MPGSYDPASKREKNYPNDVYFAAMPMRECVAATIDRCDTYSAEMIRTGRHSLYKNAHVHYLQGYASRGFIANTGALGELSAIWINHYRNLINHCINLVCQERLSWEPQIAGENTWDAMEQIKKARNILDYYASRTDMDLDGVCRDAIEKMCVFGEAWIVPLWDEFKGRIVASDGGVDTMEGDLDVKVWTPFDIFLDVTMSDINQCEWIVLRETVNKYNLCAMYPEFANDIKALSETFNTYRKEMVSYSGEVVDLVYTYRLLHKKTPAVPQGREVLFLTSDIILEDGKLDYDVWPAIRVASSDTWGTPFGYTKFFDILPIQDAIDRLSSSVLTNQLTFAIQNVLLPLDGHINHTNLYGGLHVIKYDAAKGPGYKPEALNLTQTPQEVFKNLDWHIQNAGTLAGVNDAVKGNADTVIKGQASGAALALLTTNAINFNSDIQKTWVHSAEELGTCIIKTLSKKAVTPRTGINKVGSMSTSFKYMGEDLSGITNVTVKIGSPLLQSQAGKLQVTETLIQANVGLSKEDVVNVINGQPLNSILASDEAELMLIEDENERMMNGEQVPPADILENHPLHIQKHRAKFSSVAAKQNLQALKAYQQHVQTHIDNLKNMDPVLAGLRGEPVIPKAPPPPMQKGPMPNKPALPPPAQPPVPQAPPSGVAQLPVVPH